MPANESYVRDIKKMHGVFAVSAVALFASTLWMMSADHKDEWREVQKTGEKIRAEVTKRDRDALVLDPSYKEKKENLEEEVKEARKQLGLKKDKLSAAEDKFRDAELQRDLLGRDVRFLRAERDVARANYDLKVRDGAPDDVLEQYKSIFDDFQKRVDELERRETEQAAVVSVARTELRELTADRDEASAALKKLETDEDAFKSRLAKIDPEGFSGVKRRLMDLPILDGFNSPTAIKQDWLPNLDIQLGMAKSARFDRCRTCHMNIDSILPGPVPEYPHGPSDSEDYQDWIKSGKYPHPFSTHPNVELYVTSQSPHSVEKFGCTICHDGQGSGTSFSNASHTPNDPVIEEEWHKEHHYASNHFWEYPMFPKRLLEATCLKCHHSVVELAVHPKFGNSAPKVTKGYELIKEYGCFGCHEINGYDGGKPIGPDLRLEPQTAEEAKRIAEDPTQVAGKMRKVGPSLRHIASKVSQGFVETWTELPKKFRPTTRMPQFYHLSNQEDDKAKRYTPIELAGISQYLFGRSEPIDLLAPDKGYVPNAERGKVLFSQRGCLACHSHSDFPASKADFGPNLDRVHSKIPPDADVEIGEVDGKKPSFSRWLYTWIRDPERHHPRTRMPNLFLSTYKDGDQTVDPAADIAAWLLLRGPEDFPQIPFSAEDDASDVQRKALAERIGTLEELVKLNLARAISPRLADATLGGPDATKSFISRYPVSEAAVIKGDEIELVNAATVVEAEGGVYTVDFVHSPEKSDGKLMAVWTTGDWTGKSSRVTRLARLEKNRWTLEFEFPKSRTGKDVAPPKKGDQFYVNGLITQAMKLNYVGRKTISKYGCYGCHDIPDFETARPIGTALQDWGRKDPSRLAPEHIHEFLKHHGEPDGGSTEERVEKSIKRLEQGELSGKAGDEERSVAFFYESLLHHGRPGFIWQKLREPRSYDYEKIDTKGYDERLKMPKFPFNQDEIEAVSTFVLGLVAEPPAVQYQYRPTGDAAARIEGERLLDKYNCVGCHMIDLPSITVNSEIAALPYLDELDPKDHPEAYNLLLDLKPPRDVKIPADKEGRGKLTFHGTKALGPDAESDPEDQEYLFYIWESLNVNDKPLRPAARLNVGVKDVVEQRPARGGAFAEWLIENLAPKTQSLELSDAAWQKAPPPLYREGTKVQTPWLYRFLKDPYQLRHTTLLRMPRFNMSDDEARALANYFAAADHEPFPYQDIPQRDASYLSATAHEFMGSEATTSDYLSESWKMLNKNSHCINCHSVGGRDVQVDPKKPQPRGPDLEHAADRLRPDWLEVWISNPKWITPYTSMPALYPRSAPPDPEILKGKSRAQAVGTRDALVNYARLLERFGKVTTPPPMPAAGAGGEE